MVATREHMETMLAFQETQVPVSHDMAKYMRDRHRRLQATSSEYRRKQREKQARYYAKHKDDPDWRVARKKYYRGKPKYRGKTRKAECILAYGGECLGCGEKDLRVLEIHHNNNDGAKDRGQHRVGGEVFYRKLRRQGYPQDRHLEVLCRNCHTIWHYKEEQ